MFFQPFISITIKVAALHYANIHSKGKSMFDSRLIFIEEIQCGSCYILGNVTIMSLLEREKLNINFKRNQALYQMKLP